jgi:small subunit ribosomal protein SAe
MSHIPACLQPTEEDIERLLACLVHTGHRNCVPQMQRYVYSRRADGMHIIHLGRMWEKLMFAARLIAAVKNPADVCAISTRTYGERAVLKFARYTGANFCAGRFTPGTFTNQIQKNYMEPKLLVVCDPRADKQALIEASLVNIPVIAFCNVDTPTRFVDCVIPCNNRNRNALPILLWMLAREVLRMRGELVRDAKWDVMPDLFQYREPEEDEIPKVVEEEKTSEKVSAPWGTSAAPTEEAVPVEAQPEAPKQDNPWA